MKILQINASYKPAYIYGGPTMSVSKLSEVLVKAGHQVTVFTTTANGTAELPEAVNTPLLVEGVPVYYFKRVTKDHSHFSPALLRAVWHQAKDFDAVHIHAWWNTVSVLSGLIALLKRVPVVVSPRGTLSSYSFNNRNSFYKSCIHWLLGKPVLNRSYIHATSGYEQQALSKLLRPKGLFNIPNFIQLSPRQQQQAQHTDTLKLLFLSRIEEKKGLDILLHALAGLTIPFHLTIAGSGDAVYIANLKLLVNQLNISSSVSWIGFQKENKFGLINEHHLLVLPSHDENFGNVVIESLSAGTAVLISDKVGLAGYVSEKKLGWICQTNPASVTAVINDIFNRRDELSRIKSAAPTIIAADFSEHTLLDKYITMYHTIITNG